jgi:hypothetical protein
MEILLLKDQFVEIGFQLTTTQKKYVHYHSILNFLNQFENINDLEVKRKVKDLLNAYFEEVVNTKYAYDSYSGYEIGLRYITEIGKYYSYHLGFRQELKISSALLWGIMADALLLIAGFLKNVYFIPICTLIFLMWYCYLLKFKLKGKTYGLYY